MPNRRDFMLQTAALGGALAIRSARGATVGQTGQLHSRPLRMLILGGTGNIGPRFVQAALERGHRITLFVWARAKDRTDLPAGVERLLGDRNGDLESIKNRAWDAVLDLATYGPIWVRTLGEALKGRVNHYMFISSNAVYDPAVYDHASEESAVLPYDGSADPYTLTRPSGLREYGALKALCEREAEQQFPGRTLIFRPGWITGPGNQSYSTFAYWPVRLQYGGEALVAGNPLTPVQFIDVRDLAEWAIRMIEKSSNGIYNALGPAGSATYGQVIDAARGLAAASPELTWVPSSWLAKQKDRERWNNLLFWTYESDGFAAMMRMNIRKALANGFTSRPLSVTFADVFEWYQHQPPQQQARLLMGQPKMADSAAPAQAPVSWSAYLDREREVLANWHAQSAKQS